MNDQVYGIRILGETETFPLRVAFFVVTRIRPDGQVVVYGPYSLN